MSLGLVGRSSTGLDRVRLGSLAHSELARQVVRGWSCFADLVDSKVADRGAGLLGRGVFEPGWRWSNDVKPIAGTDSCQTRHTGICLSRQMIVKFDDGREVNIGPGDVVVLEPGHDAWTAGDEDCVMLDTGVGAYAEPS